MADEEILNPYLELAKGTVSSLAVGSNPTFQAAVSDLVPEYNEGTDPLWKSPDFSFNPEGQSLGWDASFDPILNGYISGDYGQDEFESRLRENAASLDSSLEKPMWGDTVDWALNPEQGNIYGKDINGIKLEDIDDYFDFQKTVSKNKEQEESLRKLGKNAFLSGDENYGDVLALAANDIVNRYAPQYAPDATDYESFVKATWDNYDMWDNLMNNDDARFYIDDYRNPKYLRDDGSFDTRLWFDDLHSSNYSPSEAAAYNYSHSPGLSNNAIDYLASSISESGRPYIDAPGMSNLEFILKNGEKINENDDGPAIMAKLILANGYEDRGIKAANLAELVNNGYLITADKDAWKNSFDESGNMVSPYRASLVYENTPEHARASAEDRVLHPTWYTDRDLQAITPASQGSAKEEKASSNESKSTPEGFYNTAMDFINNMPEDPFYELFGRHDR